MRRRWIKPAGNLGGEVPGRGPKAGESKECWRNGMAGVWGERGNIVGNEVTKVMS